ncbi:4-phosphoerythronate dehydrogenase PdxB [Franzmannia qiaohouensis]|uniref:Erythronate-4-phosphate dehydrogenase n=1 Tax=Franzmannia qiaohouensis TaxID=1329370 RepID=A0ABU1HBU2_9GAMM|nr:4-phosphoerythronate dehydrogenase PdxB [Halomonas qiaohouensis]MDR5904938.1 4-phosphoerythronate dehydrogenase PdxB [Halomonas qiaohouensis]
MRVIVDANIPAAERCFGALGEVVAVPGREIDGAALAGAEALIVRSITRVDAALLEAAERAGARLRFVGTCTIGTDHVDQAALAARGIEFASAPGCNAEAVVDYVLSSLALLAEREEAALDQRRVGIVGAGNVGERLYRRLVALGLDCRRCDPPRAEAEPGERFYDLDSLCQWADVLCLHTPLVHGGSHATHHLLDAERITALKPGTWLLNAGRGDCLDGTALYQRLVMAEDLRAVLDVWEGEPGIDERLRRLVDIATPHIAGYSFDGKLRGTQQIYAAAMRRFGLSARLSLDDLAPRPPLSRLELGGGLPAWDALRLCMRAVYDVRRDHDGLARRAATQGMAKGFDAWRADYPLRREFGTLEVALGQGGRALAPLLSAAGFRIN